MFARAVTTIAPEEGRSHATSRMWTRAFGSEACHETRTGSPSQAEPSNVSRTVGFEVQAEPPKRTARRRTSGRVSG